VKGENILLATDGSKYSDAAEAEAINMAARCIFVKHLMAVSVVSSKDKLPEAEKRLEKVRVNAEKRDVRVETLPLVGEPYKAIVNASINGLTDTIIMGSHGRTGIERLLMGSVAERVVALAMCSVLVVKIPEAMH
jgi:hypothetical protein